MTKSFSKTQIGMAVACALALGILSGAAGAQDAKDRQFVEDARTDVVMSGFGLCWHSGFGPPPPPGPRCDPNYVAYVEPPVMKPVAVTPPAMAPAPPPAAVVAPEPPPQIYVPPPRPARKDRN